MKTAREVGKEHAKSGGWIATAKKSANRPAPLLRAAGLEGTESQCAEFLQGYNAQWDEQCAAHHNTELREAADKLFRRTYHGTTVYQADCDQFDDHSTGFYCTKEEAIDAFDSETAGLTPRERERCVVYTREEVVDDDLIESAIHLAANGSPSPALGLPGSLYEIAAALGCEPEAVIERLRAASNA